MSVQMGNSIKTANNAGGGSDNLDLDGAPEGQHNGIALYISRPTNVTGAHTPTTADLISFLNQAVSALILTEKVPNDLRTILSSLSGADLRELHRWWTRQEVWNDFVSVAQAINANQVYHARLFIPFCAPPWLDMKRSNRRPGHTQIHTLNVKITEGTAAINANSTRGAGTQIVDVEFKPIAGPDLHVPLLEMVKESSPRRDAHTPDGLPLLIYYAGQAAAASPLAAYTVDVGGRRQVDVQAVASTTRDYAAETLDSSTQLLTDAETVLYAVGSGEQLERLPIGVADVVEAKSDLSPLDLRVIVIPTRDEKRARAFAAHAAAKYGRKIMLQQTPVALNEQPGAAAIEPAEIIVETDARFTTAPGLMGFPGTNDTAVVVPEEWKKRHAAAGKGREGDDAKRRLRKVAGLHVPGAHDTKGNRVGSLGAVIEATFA